MPELYYQTCYWCRENFGIPYNLYRGKVQLGQKDFFCSGKCFQGYESWMVNQKRMRDVREGGFATRHSYRFGGPEKPANPRCKKRLHEMTEDNIYRSERENLCRKCRAINAARYRRRVKKRGQA